MPSWNEGLKIGVPQIDEQHKTLFDAVDVLFAACAQGKGRQEIGKTLDFLVQYAAKHFADEEVVQKNCGYPKCEEHKHMHEDFKVQVASLKQEFHATGPTVAMVAKMNTILSGWLVNHIKNVDSEITRYIK